MSHKWQYTNYWLGSPLLKTTGCRTFPVRRTKIKTILDTEFLYDEFRNWVSFRELAKRYRRETKPRPWGRWPEKKGRK